ncbi:hypothetical protein HanHA300_Chr09g0302641 [Helianthus annuus]|nr:hypothetical protein HanHA300_Chr09g0302641 [Helianthus annuus]
MSSFMSQRLARYRVTVQMVICLRVTRVVGHGLITGHETSTIGCMLKGIIPCVAPRLLNEKGRD